MQHSTGNAVNNLQAIEFGWCILLLVLFWWPSFGNAQIIISGDYSPVYDNTDPWEVGDFLLIGDTGSGSMRVLNNSVVNSIGGELGRFSGSFGAAEINGANAIWDTGSAELWVGQCGEGVLSILNGGQVQSANARIGYSVGGTGTVNVSGTGSTWQIENHLGFGSGLGGGHGKLTIQAGGRVIVGGDVNLGGEFPSQIVNVTGPNSLLDISGSLWIGDWTSADFTISNGARVRSALTSIVGEDLDEYDYDARMEVTGKGSVMETGMLEVGGIDSAFYISNGGTVSTSGDVSIYGDAIVYLNGGTLDVGGNWLSMEDQEHLEFTGGVLANAERIFGGLVQQGGSLSPGNSAGLTEIFVKYEIDAGQITLDLLGLSEHDRISVNGEVDLLGGNSNADATLDILLGFAPSARDSFEIISNDGVDAILGQFAHGNTVSAIFDNTEYFFRIDYTGGTGNDIVLTVVPEPSTATSAGWLFLVCALLQRTRPRRRAGSCRMPSIS